MRREQKKDSSEEKLRKKISDHHKKEKAWEEQKKALGAANANAANLMVELEEKNTILEKARNDLAHANVHAAELMAELEEKNTTLENSKNQLARANAQAAIYVAELKEKNLILEEAKDKIARANAHAAMLMVELEEKNQALETAIEKIKADKKYVDDIFKTMLDTLIVIDTDLIIRTVNDATVRLLGYKQKDLVGQPIDRILSKEEITTRKKALLDVIKRKGVLQNFEINYLTKSGREIPMLLGSTVLETKIYDFQSSIQDLTESKNLDTTLSVLCAAKDITRRKEAEMLLEKAYRDLEEKATAIKKANEQIKVLYKELEQKNRKLEDLNQLKSDFVSIVSHELRIPLTVIKESINLMYEEILGEINDRQKDMLEISSRSIDRLIRIINNLLDLSKIEAGKVDLHLKSFDLNELIDSVFASFEIQTRKQNIRMEKETFARKITIEADYDKLIQVFTNLLGNALKFTENGAITVTVEDKNTEIECSVIDSGIGILPEDLPKVFGKFQQLGSRPVAGQKGTGLGLSISKAIVELHHGTIWVESEYGKGTSFIFTIPKKQNS